MIVNYLPLYILAISNIETFSNVAIPAKAAVVSASFHATKARAQPRVVSAETGTALEAVLKRIAFLGGKDVLWIGPRNKIAQTACRAALADIAAGKSATYVAASLATTAGVELRRAENAFIFFPKKFMAERGIVEETPVSGLDQAVLNLVTKFPDAALGCQASFDPGESAVSYTEIARQAPADFSKASASFFRTMQIENPTQEMRAAVSLETLVLYKCGSVSSMVYSKQEQLNAALPGIRDEGNKALSSPVLTKPSRDIEAKNNFSVYQGTYADLLQQGKWARGIDKRMANIPYFSVVSSAAGNERLQSLLMDSLGLERRKNGNAYVISAAPGGTQYRTQFRAFISRYNKLCAERANNRSFATVGEWVPVSELPENQRRFLMERYRDELRSNPQWASQGVNEKKFAREGRVYISPKIVLRLFGKQKINGEMHNFRHLFGAAYNLPK